VFHNVRTRVHNCVFQANQFALRAVTAKDVTLELIGNTINGDLWYDNSRPGNLVSSRIKIQFAVIRDAHFCFTVPSTASNNKVEFVGAYRRSKAIRTTTSRWPTPVSSPARMASPSRCDRSSSASACPGDGPPAKPAPLPSPSPRRWSSRRAIQLDGAEPTPCCRERGSTAPSSPAELRTSVRVAACGAERRTGRTEARPGRTGGPCRSAH
jgi:hypothetical protein